MRLDLTDFRLFLNVLEAGTITAGAEATHMTLASASERIRGMEEDLGVELLQRESRGVRPTPAGMAFAHHARLVLQQMDRMQGELGEYGEGLKGHVRILCNTSALSEHLPEVLGTFLARHPGISIDLEEKSSFEIVNAVRDRACDIGMISDSADTTGLTVIPFRPDPLVLVVPAQHILAERQEVALTEVVDFPFVGMIEGSALHEHITHHARRLGKRLNYRIRVRSFESVCRVVGIGIGIGIVPKTVASRCTPIFKIKELVLNDPWASRNLVICVREEDTLSGQAQLLIKYVLEGREHN